MDFLFLKQVLNYCESRRILYSPVFRAKNYKFESNSQHIFGGCFGLFTCFSRQKLQIWKQFTTLNDMARNAPFLFFAPKITNLKAIHNTTKIIAVAYSPVFRAKNYKFESNSQHCCCFSNSLISCFSRQKLQIWKQFTTIRARLAAGRLLFFAPKITNLKAIHNVCPVLHIRYDPVFRAKNYKFESNSQHLSAATIENWPCFSRQKLQIWKQFTTKIAVCRYLITCFSRQKLQIWKQFTT